MLLRKLLALLLKLLLFFSIVVLAIEDVEVMSLPVLLGCLSSQDLLVCNYFLVVVVDVLVVHDVVVFNVVSWSFTWVFRLLLRVDRPLLWSIEVVLLQRVVCNNVVWSKRVTLRTEVPGLLLRVVRSVLQAC
jgi:hypothetical protein